MGNLFLGIVLLVLSIAFAYAGGLLYPAKARYVVYKAMMEDPKLSEDIQKYAKIMVDDLKPVYQAFFVIRIAGTLLSLLSGMVFGPSIISLFV